MRHAERIPELIIRQPQNQPRMSTMSSPKPPYLYYRADGKYRNSKEELFAWYEQHFDEFYEGSEADKEGVFKEYMSDLLAEKASDMYSTVGELAAYYFNVDALTGHEVVYDS